LTAFKYDKEQTYLYNEILAHLSDGTSGFPRVIQVEHSFVQSIEQRIRLVLT
jgi:hypothetical protein